MAYQRLRSGKRRREALEELNNTLSELDTVTSMLKVAIGLNESEETISTDLNALLTALDDDPSKPPGEIGTKYCLSIRQFRYLMALEPEAILTHDQKQEALSIVKAAYKKKERLESW